MKYGSLAAMGSHVLFYRGQTLHQKKEIYNIVVIG